MISPTPINEVKMIMLPSFSSDDEMVSVPAVKIKENPDM